MVCMTDNELIYIYIYIYIYEEFHILGKISAPKNFT